MGLKFSKEEIETELGEFVPHGKRVQIARLSGVGESYLKRQLNPDDEIASCFFTTLRIACAFDEIDEALGNEFWEAICRFRELSKERLSGRVIDLAEETGKLNKEIAEFVMAKLKNEPIDKQLSELADARRELEKLEQDLMLEYQRLEGQVTLKRVS